jgi:hypothetical protein
LKFKSFTLSEDELNRAEKKIIKLCQGEVFQKEIQGLKFGTEISISPLNGLLAIWKLIILPRVNMVKEIYRIWNIELSGNIAINITNQKRCE